MNQIETVKRICGILMAGGAAVLLFMISDLIYRTSQWMALCERSGTSNQRRLGKANKVAA